jgi:hypothetical protein
MSMSCPYEVPIDSPEALLFSLSDIGGLNLRAMQRVSNWYTWLLPPTVLSPAMFTHLSMFFRIRG